MGMQTGRCQLPQAQQRSASCYHFCYWASKAKLIRAGATRELIGESKPPGILPNPIVSKLVVMAKLTFLNVPNSSNSNLGL